MDKSKLINYKELCAKAQEDVIEKFIEFNNKNLKNQGTKQSEFALQYFQLEVWKRDIM